MILIGQYDSPFVRRVGIALVLYGLDFEHRPWSVFGDADLLRALNPLTRVPVLVLADGTALTDSHLILDYLDGLVGDRALFPGQEPERHRALRRAALATGLADKSVSLFYERRLHDPVSPIWEARCATQIGAVLAVLEAERAAAGDWWAGATMGHEDVALACALRFLTDAHPALFDPQDHPALTNHASGCEALPVFQRIRQPFKAPT